ncbi:G2/mitotic-specific cyclin-B3-like isoform X2 [Mya arenaria]|uniref:G2/mitotic-specific cyclin-B3-like isoform X2 n=1 Tax=Mya arenaria TaxID=6604 RepID=UPI0022DF97FD|nr:G2/mitotic-specific cyclin-B3-like isoform X2 [Mya arenaria]
MIPARRGTRPVATGENVRKVKSGTALGKAAGTTAGKRQGDMLQDPSQKRRAAFGDITNALSDKENIKIALKKSKLPTTAGGLVKPVLPGKKITKENKPLKKKDRPQKVPSNENLTDESSLSLLISSQESNSSGSSSQESIVSANDLSCQGVEDLVPLDDTEDKVLEGIDDVDKENLQDPVQVALYAFHIFEYYKERELLFKVEPYMSSQRFLTSSMRAILVDWLVEVQENFELNHETLYLAVKLVDMYMSTITTPKESVQLVGAVALFIAAKFDERCPPLVEDFLYICDDAYKRTEFLDMERAILHAVGFDIGMPLSYRFLRRYAKCNRANMETLTLGRYILEMSLMEYDFVPRRESEMAAAALFLALRMKNTGTWNKTMVHYTGYTEEELRPLARKLNNYITSPPKQLTTIRSKYSHKVFYEVAKVPALSDSELA